MAGPALELGPGLGSGGWGLEAASWGLGQVPGFGPKDLPHEGRLTTLNAHECPLDSPHLYRVFFRKNYITLGGYL